MSSASQLSFNMDLDKNLDPKYEGKMYFFVQSRFVFGLERNAA